MELGCDILGLYIHMDGIQDYLLKERQEHLKQFSSLLRFASISTKVEHASNVRDCARWLKGHMETIGMESTQFETDGHPILVARTPFNPKKKTVLVYGHYDVQPVDPLNLWQSPPFEPTIRGGRIYARGASDDKGQIFAHIKSVEAYLQTDKDIPVNVVFLIEGEEEIGSPNLGKFLQKNKKLLQADLIVISDNQMFRDGLPAITYGLRGIQCVEIRVTGPDRDLHSGIFGGTVLNPAMALTQILGAMIDKKGRVTIPGFYDDVKPLSPEERKELKKLPFDEKAYTRMIGVNQLHGETGFSPIERTGTRPTFEINGIYSGYQGTGSKTIIPSIATAKISMRLVPDQKPEKILEALRNHIEALKPPGVKVDLIDQHGGEPYVFPLKNPAIKAASKALELAFGVAPVLMREGGSIPIVSQFKQILGCDTLLIGLGLPEDKVHSPNENFKLDNFYRGSLMSAYLWPELAAVLNGNGRK